MTLSHASVPHTRTRTPHKARKNHTILIMSSLTVLWAREGDLRTGFGRVWICADMSNTKGNTSVRGSCQSLQCTQRQHEHTPRILLSRASLSVAPGFCRLECVFLQLTLKTCGLQQTKQTQNEHEEKKCRQEAVDEGMTETPATILASIRTKQEALAHDDTIAA